jgi:hypothetical protein
MEEARKIAREVRVNFKQAVDAQSGQPANVAVAFKSAFEKLVGAMTTNWEGLTNEILEGVKKYAEESQEKCEYLYTCKSGISATLYIDVALTL